MGDRSNAALPMTTDDLLELDDEEDDEDDEDDLIIEEDDEIIKTLSASSPDSVFIISPSGCPDHVDATDGSIEY